ncbi:acyl-CoA-binding domain-containing protein 6 isoform X5 [Cavia porcellus]|uniref:acyl-CoA-binding domain-containing protein 6 isoform X5 n=1 Tax=Cavia porcellus TaxID=10141 RepID=UPI002FE1DE8D
MATPFVTAGAVTGHSGGELSSGDDSGDVEMPQTPETEASRSLTELFEKAAAHLQGLIQVASREQLLYLYARYKQVRVGNCNTPKPSFFDFEGKQKWEAWKALGDSSPTQAMQEYIAVVKKLDPGWNPQDNEGQTALHYAAACEFLDIVELLLQSGADPALRDQDGCVPEEVTGCKAVSLVLQRHVASKA